jgi:hydroxypyruvate reductase
MIENLPAGTPDRALLEDLYRAAVGAVDPGPAVAAALVAGRHAGAARGHHLWIVALGKAAVPMAVAAVSVAVDNELAIAGGLVVAPAGAVTPHPALRLAIGDHPEPGPGSFAAATALGDVAAQVRDDDHVWVLLSGGTTSLIGAPLEGIPHHDLRDLYSLLLGSGLDISAMNRVRKRFTRWGGGRLAAALGGASVRQFIVSDVIGDDLPSIGSGPCVPDSRHRGRGALCARSGRTLAASPGHPAGAGTPHRRRHTPGNTEAGSSGLRLGAYGNCVE